MAYVGAGKGAWNIASRVADPEMFFDDHVTGEVKGVPVVGKIADIPKFATQIEALVITITSSMQARIRAYETAKSGPYICMPPVRMYSGEMPDLNVGEATIISAHTYLGPATKLGVNCFLATGCIIEHDNVIGDHVLIGPCCVTSGDVHIGSRTRLGTGVFIEPHVRIHEGCIIRSGAVIPEGVEIPRCHTVERSGTCHRTSSVSSPTTAPRTP